MAKTPPAPNRVKSMNDLRATADEANATDLTNVPSAKRLVYLEFKCIRDFRRHAFHLYTGERLSDMVESIRQNGILIPLIVQRIYDDPDFDYEMLSGHNRKNAGMMAGLVGALCLVKEGLTYQEALMYVVETNLIQRSFSDMLPSERAAVLALRYNEMFSQGKRNDIIRELQILNGESPDQTSGTEFHKSLSRDCLGEKYNLTGRSIANYLRLDKLIDPLKERLDGSAFTIKAGVNLSYIPETEQGWVEDVLSSTQGKLSDGKAAEIRKKYEAQELDESAIRVIIQVALKARAVAVKLSQQTYSRYFSPKASKAEVEKTIDCALALYFSQHEKSEETKDA